MLQILLHTEVGVYSLVALVLTIGLGFVISYGAKKVLHDQG